MNQEHLQNILRVIVSEIVMVENLIKSKLE